MSMGVGIGSGSEMGDFANEAESQSSDMGATYSSPGGASGGPSSSDFGSYSQAIGSGTSALVNLMMGNKLLKDQKKITGIQHTQYIKQYQDAMKTSSQSELEAQRQYGRALPEMQAEYGARGMGNSSGAAQNRSDLAYQNALQVDSIRRQRALQQGGFQAQTQIWDLQKKMARTQQQTAAISAGIDTAISVASAFSDARLKKGVETIDADKVLEALERLPISTWTYEWEPDGVRHMGPMAQDFQRVFGLGEPVSEKPAKIMHVDATGVLLAAVKALAARVKELEGRA